MVEELETKIVKNLAQFRLALENPSVQEVELTMNDLYPNVVGKVTALFANRELILKMLARNKASYKSRGEEISRRQNSISLVADIMVYTFQNAAVQFRDDPKDVDHRFFKFYFDFSQGSRVPLAMMEIAENESYGLGEDLRLASIAAPSEITGIENAAGDQANDYLSMIRNDAKLAERIILDPSGFSLVGETVKKVEDVLISNKKFIREYFAAGAALTRDIYKKVYEFAAPLYPEK